MDSRQGQIFGGDWTEKKLEKVRKYINAYTIALSNQVFKRIYIDGFAGTGYREESPPERDEGTLFPEPERQEEEEYHEGSTRIALQIDRPFDRYIFIEEKPRSWNKLKTLKTDFPSLANRIELENKDSNTYLQSVCRDNDWGNYRAVLFLDPYGMQVDWKTIEAVAQTRKMDMIILFPAGIAVNRMLPESGKIQDSWVARLDSFFGEREWRQEFYQEEKSLFGGMTITRKVGGVAKISRYYLSRLRTVFSCVGDKPYPLKNRQGMPLFDLCFASESKLAIKIANDIWKKE